MNEHIQGLVRVNHTNSMGAIFTPAHCRYCQGALHFGESEYLSLALCAPSVKVGLVCASCGSVDNQR